MMTRAAFCLVVVTLAGSGCAASVTAPTAAEPGGEPAADVATISGRIYATVSPEFPSIPDAVVEVNEADGSTFTAVSDAGGFYRISARRGSITITASKEGYEAKQWQFDLLKDTVLNFSLNPQ
jgi:hypothetical protein